MTLQIEILNPKAKKLLQDLADLNLIAIKNPQEESFFDIVGRLRSKAKKLSISDDEIIKEVELVREKRYAKSKA
ncbi:hypothetical protein GS399_11225 [Pedobacter sp. HMF7647]|uniref:Uncharacterized protein n=1 Tax=Hufsiella arboris TaxID=2695275 RepID=A0A7K1YAE6_9SPHI|nr:hypothetical protein [Hufsiella arboris]MXV51543.1 hypothetical protein [Hufsiella arboris]